MDEAILRECERRYILRQGVVPLPNDPPEVAGKKKDRLVVLLHEWANDPVRFARDNAWVPDRQHIFGNAPDGLSPRGMIPLLMTPKQEAIIRMWRATLDAEGKRDAAVDKTRQFAVTSYFLWCVALHGFLFGKAASGLLGSYSDDVIDKGGKGQRDDTSLFGRLRLFLDAFMWNFSYPRGRDRVSVLAFTRPRPVRKGRRKEDESGIAGMPESDDISYKLVRPRWFLEGHGELFPGGEGNWLQGALPGDGFGRSYSATWALMDEVDHYSHHIREGADRDAWGSTTQNVRCRFLIGTPYKHGAANSLLKEVCLRPDGPFLSVMHADWCDLPFYMLGASWECPRCRARNPLKATESPGAGTMEKECPSCGRAARLSRFTIASPWLEEARARCLGDKAAEAAEIFRDWEGVRTDRFFAGFDAREAIRCKPLSASPIMYDGFDPGHSSVYPAAFLAVALDRLTARPRVVGYWMASGTLIEWWVPFFKRWHPRVLERVHVQYGQKKGWPWRLAFEYGAEALEMLEALSEHAPAHVSGDLYGDTSGSKRMMVESPYEVLESYGVNVNHRYTADREALCAKGVTWAASLEVEPRIAMVRPPAPDGRRYPSVLDVFTGARTVKLSQTERVDVDAKDPAFVKNAADAWFYLCRGLDDRTQRAVATGERDEEGRPVWTVADMEALRAGGDRYGGDLSLG